jgi:hypothetical protein
MQSVSVILNITNEIVYFKSHGNGFFRAERRVLAVTASKPPRLLTDAYPNQQWL